MIYRVLVCGLFSFCFFLGVAQADTPPEVLKAYAASEAALKDKDVPTALKYARTAWEQAEALMGDDPITGVLAYNYATVSNLNKGKSKDTRKAYERSIALAHLQDTPVETRLQREVSLGQFLVREGKESAFKKRFAETIEFADVNKADKSLYLAELYTLRSQVEISRRSHDKTEIYAQKALDLFETADSDRKTYYPYLAHLYSGYGKEGQENFIPAILEYQHVMQDLEGELPKDHPFLMRALGRWMTMRNRIVREGLKDEAEAQGMCECWPFDKDRNENVRPIKRVPPDMPSRAWQSGFSIVEFDIDDTGNTVNPRILESWPKGIWDSSSIRAVKKWKYSPRTEGETESDRTELVTTLRYILKDPNGRIIE